MTGIYKITSPDSRVYIGKTRNWEDRIRQYKSLQCARQAELYTSLCKYGWFNHKFELIHALPEEVEEPILIIYEVLFIDQYKSNINKYPDNRGMNMTDGGTTVSPNTFSKSVNEARSLALKGRPKTKEHAKKIGDGHRGKKLTKEHIEKLRICGEKCRKPIVQYDLNGNFIKEWDSVKSAGNFLGIAPTNISQCLLGKVGRTKQFTWKYKSKTI